MRGLEQGISVSDPPLLGKRRAAPGPSVVWKSCGQRCGRGILAGRRCAATGRRYGDQLTDVSIGRRRYRMATGSASIPAKRSRALPAAGVERGPGPKAGLWPGRDRVGRPRRRDSHRRRRWRRDRRYRGRDCRRLGWRACLRYGEELILIGSEKRREALPAFAGMPCLLSWP